MPELPEVETIRKTLVSVVGAQIESVWWSGKNLRQGKPVNLRALQEYTCGRSIEGVRRLGKYLILDLLHGSRSILVHLGMSGRLRYFSPQHPRPPHTHVEWSLCDGRFLRFSDPRRFGIVELVLRGHEGSHPSLAKLGADPIRDLLDPSAFHAACSRTRRPIKITLLDQRLLAGIGNIYASEALWAARIHPEMRTSRLSLKRCERLLCAVRDVLQRALLHGGTSLRDFVSADGQIGDHSHYLWVYGRENERCPKEACAGRIRRIMQQQRASFYCPHCQK